MPEYADDTGFVFSETDCERISEAVQQVEGDPRNTWRTRRPHPGRAGPSPPNVRAVRCTNLTPALTTPSGVMLYSGVIMVYNTADQSLVDGTGCYLQSANGAAFATTGRKWPARFTGYYTDGTPVFMTWNTGTGTGAGFNLTLQDAGGTDTVINPATKISFDNTTGHDVDPGGLAEGIVKGIDCSMTQIGHVNLVDQVMGLGVKKFYNGAGGLQYCIQIGVDDQNFASFYYNNVIAGQWLYSTSVFTSQAVYGAYELRRLDANTVQFKLVNGDNTGGTIARYAVLDATGAGVGVSGTEPTTGSTFHGGIITSIGPGLSVTDGTTTVNATSTLKFVGATVSSGSAVVTINATGTVTSVGLSMPTQFSVSGSPVTGSGTLTVSWGNQTKNTVLSGPSSGAAAAPTFRVLVGADINGTSTGDLWYQDSGGNIARLGIGSTNQVLTVASGLPSWATAGSGGGGSSITPHPAQCRLSLVSSDPAPATDQLAATTIYLVPYGGDQLALYDGTKWAVYTVNNQTVSPPGASNQTFDIFAFISSGAIALETLNWTNDTTRATAIATQNGIPVKSGDATRRYMGTGHTTGTSGQIEDSRQRRFVFNYYNRLSRQLLYTGSLAASWSYSSAAWRAANATTYKVEAVLGGYLEVEDCVRIMVRATGEVTVTTTGTVAASVGIGVDGTTTNSADIWSEIQYQSTDAVTSSSQLGAVSIAEYTSVPGLGYHSFNWLEYNRGGIAMTWYGKGATPQVQSGISGVVRC
jgi:hypothetical protein